MKENKTNLILSIWNTIGIVIIAGFFLFGFIIGGTAALGYCEANTYYVGNHGEYTQVSEIIYHVSYVCNAPVRRLCFQLAKFGVTF